MKNAELTRKALSKLLKETDMRESRKKDRKNNRREEVRLLQMATVPDVRTPWLWPGRIVMENLTLLVGEPEVGKSTVTFDLAARLSRGGTWPDGTPIGEPKSTLFVSAENHACFTMRQGLAAAGADMDHVAMIWDVWDTERGEGYQRPFELPRDLSKLRREVKELPNCKLVVIDPIMSIMEPAAMRLTLRRLMLMSCDLHVAVLGLAHLRPGGLRALDRTDGGLALTSAARAVWMVTEDPQVEAGSAGSGTSCGSRKLLLPVKNNLVPERTGLAYSVANVEGRPRLTWESTKVEQRVDTVLAEQRRYGMEADKLREAIEFLQQALAEGPRPVKDVESEALYGWDISRRTLVRARKAVGVQKFREKPKGAWWMHLARKEGDDPILQTDGTVGRVGTVSEKAEKEGGFSECLSVPDGTLSTDTKQRSESGLEAVSESNSSPAAELDEATSSRLA